MRVGWQSLYWEINQLNPHTIHIHIEGYVPLQLVDKLNESFWT